MATQCITTTNSIPKIIHYCWFGGNSKSKTIKKCMKSWQIICPDYQIIEWNEDNFDINCCDYVMDAYKLKKWAFVSDYARHKVLFEYGGVYLDTDVELIKPIDDLLNTPFMGIENNSLQINTGLIFACRKGDAYCKYMLDDYDNSKFELVDGKYYTVCTRTTTYMEKLGYRKENELQKIGDYTIYPVEYFSAVDAAGNVMPTEQSYSVHHFQGSWLPKKVKLKITLVRIFGAGSLKLYIKLKNLFKRDRRQP